MYGEQKNDLNRGVQSFIHSFIPAISIAPLQVLYYSEALPTTARILYRSFTPKRPQATAAKGLAQGPYVAARAGVEPTTLWLRVIISTKAPPRPSTWTATKARCINASWPKKVGKQKKRKLGKKAIN